jgi:putative transcriptional regulator
MGTMPVPTNGVPSKGMLLVATPPLADPNFDRTVVLVLEHGDGGAIGLVLNRPSETPVADALPGWEDLAAEPATVFAGGPVSTDAAIALGAARHTGAGGGWEPLVGDVGTIDLHRDPDDIAGDIAAVRIFAGYAGWGPGQLESELEANAWLVVPAWPEDAIGDPDDLWRRVLLRQGGRVAWLANAPLDPSRN